MVATMGTDIAFPLGMGGPLEDVRLWNGVKEDYGEAAETAARPRSVTEADEASEDDSTADAQQASSFELSVDNLDVTDGTERDVDAESDLTDGTDVETAAVEPEPEPEPERPLVVTHVVQSGETLWDIARLYEIDVDTIVAANESVDPNRLRVGESLSILTVPGALHTVRRGESLWDISRMYDVTIDEIASNNGISDPSRVQVQARLVIPGAQAQAAALRRDAVVSADGRLIRNFDWPLRGRISSRYGPRWDRIHHGLDVAVPVGTPIRSAAGGVVSFSGAMGGYGNIVIIDHGNGVETRYAHTSRNIVRVGQRVQRGDLIAYSGNTGNSTGPHLHFEVRQRGQSVNPELYLR